MTVPMFYKVEILAKALHEGGFLDELDGDVKPLTKEATIVLLKKVATVLRDGLKRLDRG